MQAADAGSTAVKAAPLQLQSLGTKPGSQGHTSAAHKHANKSVVTLWNGLAMPQERLSQVSAGIRKGSINKFVA